MVGADFAYGVVPAIIAADAGFPGDYGPGAVAGADRLAGFAIGLKRDIEVAAIAFAHLPFADEVIAAGSAGAGFEFDAGDVGGGNALLAAILENHGDGRLEIDAGEIRRVNRLAMAILEDDYD